MLNYIVKRGLAVFIVVWGATVVVFFMMKLVPGDVIHTILGPMARPEQIQTLMQHYGLDKPLYAQYIIWLGHMVTGKWGTSIAFSEPISYLIQLKVGKTLVLTGGSILIAIIFGFIIGIISGMRPFTVLDNVLMAGTIAGASIPIFWLGLVLIYFFSVRVQIFPVGGISSVTGPGGVLDVLHHLILPAFTTAAIPAAVIARVTRSEIVDILSKPHIVGLRAKGLSSKRIVFHVLRGITPSVVNITGLQVGYVFGWALFTEIIFKWPGIGLLMYDAIVARDVPLVQVAVLVFACVFALVNFFSDVVRVSLDPQMRTLTTGRPR